MESTFLRLPHQSTTNIVQLTHHDVIHNISYDCHGRMLATICGDQVIKIFKLMNNEWIETQQIKEHRHKSRIIDICWAHPLFGSIFATYSVDKMINIFELCLNDENNALIAFEFVLQSFFGEVMDIICCEFLPYHLGLKLAVVCKDGIVKIMEVRDANSTSEWMLSQQIVINANIQTPFKHKNIVSGNNNNNLLDIQLNKNTKIFCISWNKNQFEFTSFCVGANKNKIFIFGYTSNHNNFNKRWNEIQKINIVSSNNNEFDVDSICWSNHIARKYHLIACGCSDGFVRIITMSVNENKFEWNLIFESKQIYNNSISKIKWNASATSLLSVGCNGNIYLFKKDRINDTYIHNCLTIKAQKVGKHQANFKEEAEEEKDEIKESNVNNKNNNQSFGFFDNGNGNFGANTNNHNHNHNNHNNNNDNNSTNNGGGGAFNFGSFGNNNNDGGGFSFGSFDNDKNNNTNHANNNNTNNINNNQWGNSQNTNNNPWAWGKLNDN